MAIDRDISQAFAQEGKVLTNRDREMASMDARSREGAFNDLTIREGRELHERLVRERAWAMSRVSALDDFRGQLRRVIGSED